MPTPFGIGRVARTGVLLTPRPWEQWEVISAIGQTWDVISARHMGSGIGQPDMGTTRSDIGQTYMESDIGQTWDVISAGHGT
jgi:hypothetical protein